MATEPRLSDGDMPSLFIDADSASLKAQQTYLRLIKADITLVAIAAFVGAFSPDDVVLRDRLAYSTAVIFAISIVVSSVLAIRRYDRIWYGGRAVAESVKTLAWRFAMRAEPYDTTDTAAVERFTSDLNAILAQKKYLATAFLGDDSTSKPQISDEMYGLRGADTATRAATYLANRVDDQRDWYRRKSRFNHRLEAQWFWVVVASQLGGLLAALALVRWPESHINGTGVFSSIAAAAAAWIQIKRHQELAQSYAVASSELALARERGKLATTDATLSEFVGDAENAISREHTLWTARRDV